MDSMTAIFAPALQKYTSQLLLRISEEYKIPIDDMNAKYLTSGVPIKPKAPRKPKEPTAERPMCPFLCGTKKTPCKNRCIPNGAGCHLHDPERLLAEAAKPKPPKEPKPPKVLKGDSLTTSEPVDTRTLSEAAKGLSQAAKALADDIQTRAQVQVEEPLVEEEEDIAEEPLDDTSIHDRLRAMLAEEDEAFEEEEEEYED